MSGSVPVPASLFLPSDEPARPASSLASDQPSHHLLPSVYVSVPILSSAQKAEYKQGVLPDHVQVDEKDIDRILGEAIIQNILFYFVRFHDGIAHKFPAKVFKANHRNHVKDYEHKKKKGLLDPFDPSSSSCTHDHSRVRLNLNIHKKSSDVKVWTTFGPGGTISDMSSLTDLSSGSEQEEEGSIDSEYLEEEENLPTRRSIRNVNAQKRVKPLPFSPRKTRSRKVYVVEDSDGNSKPDSDDELGLVPRTRSTRFRTRSKSKKADDRYASLEDEEDEEGSDADVEIVARKAIKPKKRRDKSFIRRAAYGRIRAIADLGYDSQSDDEIATLREHRSICEKCHRGPAHELIEALRKKPKGRAKRVSDDFEEEGDDEERLTALGGWLRCLKCPVVAHWRCLAAPQREEILKSARGLEMVSSSSVPRSDAGSAPDVEQSTTDSRKSSSLVKRVTLGAYETTEFICNACMKGGICMSCMEVALQPDPGLLSKDAPKQDPPAVQQHAPDVQSTSISKTGTTDDSEKPSTTDVVEKVSASTSRERLYRCFSCKRLAHYRCLPCPPSMPDHVDLPTIAEWYQSTAKWFCPDCSSFTYGLDKIIAWRPYPPNAVEPARPADEPPNYKSLLPREYLVKWVDRSFRRTQWVPHMWLVSTQPAKLRNFLTGGSKVELLAEPAVIDDAKDAEGQATLNFDVEEDELSDAVAKADAMTPVLPSDPIPDAELKIPLPWKTVDRVLDILLWCPKKREFTVSNKKNRQAQKKKGRQKTIESDEELTGDDDMDDQTKEEHAAAFANGEQPPEDVTETLREFETRTRARLGISQIHRVVWAFIKWSDLGYEEATWDAPPRPGEYGYAAFEKAFQRFINSRSVKVPRLSVADIKAMENRPKDGFRRDHLLKNDEQPELGQNSQLKLMPFQTEGFNWLCNNWWNRQPCILADEMGLGKTVQIAAFIGNIIKRWEAYPILVVVPNSTLTNWIREVEKWAPLLRVVPFYGEAKAREVIKQFELNHDVKEPGTTGAKFHVLVTTYESLHNTKDFNSVFKSQPRWEVLVVDEGQRLKNDGSLIFKKLNQLNTAHRIIMTGTPLNNNIRELFNLMNFLEPEKWSDLEKLEKEHEELTEDLIRQLHHKLRPYFLRRTKSEVLQLPPKNEVIVPVSMTPLQKEVYRSILSQNVAVLKGLTEQSKSKATTAKIKTNVHNIVMQLRKCLQHPYLYAENLEPAGLSPGETHEKLIDASAKLHLLKMLLPKLKARGHRVLLFSQFVIALNIIEDFLEGEQFKYLRLDGNTKQAERQKGMDEFNRPGSDIFIYLLSTRAGGVGINLWSADTVIVFDPDYNPHQDLQAIARAHRYGQTKTCLVFKLMVKDSAEERIIQTGKKKMVLDHLIVQKMDEEDPAGGDMQSILTYGAQALFDEDQSAQRDIVYTDHDIEKLIEKTEKEGDQQEETKDQGLSFSFAKIWAADKDDLEEVADNPADDQGDSWAQALQRIAAVQQQRQVEELTGRGVRRRVAVFPQQHIFLDDSPEQPKLQKSVVKAQSSGSDGSAYSDHANKSDDDDSDIVLDAHDAAFDELLAQFGQENPLHYAQSSDGSSPVRPGMVYSAQPRSHPVTAPLSQIHNPSNYIYDDEEDMEDCGLCGMRHIDGACSMTESSEYLAEYRKILIMDSADEPFEERLAAVKAIDVTLAKRGKLMLIAGQPLQIVQHPGIPMPAHSKRNENLLSHPVASQAGAVQRVAQAKPAPASKHHAPQPARAIGSAQVVRAAPTNYVTKSLPKAGVVMPFASSSAAVNHQQVTPSTGLKRASPFGPEHSNKKPRQGSLPHCVVCGQSYHLMKDCPAVLEGPKRISREISRLENDPLMSSSVSVLRKILRKHTKAAAHG